MTDKPLNAPKAGALVLVEDYFTEILEDELGRQIQIHGYLDNVCASFKRLFGRRGQLFVTEGGEWGIKVQDESQAWRVVAPSSDVFELQSMQVDPGPSQVVNFTGQAAGFSRKRVHCDINTENPSFEFPVEDQTVSQVAKRMRTAASPSGLLQDVEIQFPCTLRGLQDSALEGLKASTPTIIVQPGPTDSASIRTTLVGGKLDATILGFTADYSGAKSGTLAMTIEQTFRGNAILLSYQATTGSFLPSLRCDRKPDDPEKPGPPVLIPLVVELVKAATVIAVACILDYLSAFFAAPAAIATDQIALNNLATATEEGIEKAAGGKAKPKLPDYVKGFRDQFKVKPPSNAEAVTKAFPKAAATDLATGLDEAYGTDLTSKGLTEALWKAKTPPFMISDVAEGLYKIFGSRSGYLVENFVQDLYSTCVAQQP